MASRPVSWADLPVELSVRRLSWVNMQTLDEIAAEDAAAADAGNTVEGVPLASEPPRPDTPDQSLLAIGVHVSPVVVVGTNEAANAAAGSTDDASDGIISPRAARYNKRQTARRRLHEAATSVASPVVKVPVRRSTRKSAPRRIPQPK